MSAQRMIKGIGVSPGVAYAPAVVVREAAGVRGWPVALAAAVAVAGVVVGQRRLVRLTGVGFGLAAFVVVVLVRLAVG